MITKQNPGGETPPGLNRLSAGAPPTRPGTRPGPVTGQAARAPGCCLLQPGGGAAAAATPAAAVR